jgi:hypothetical protein
MAATSAQLAAAQAKADRFARDFRRLLKLAADRADIVARQVNMSIGKGLVLASPVGNPTLWKHPAPKGYAGGRFRANWQHGFNIRPSGQIDAIDPAGTNTIEQLNARIAATEGSYGVNFYVNNLPYGNRLEYGHHSSQVPAAGMVGLVMLDFHKYVLEAARVARAKASS